MTISANDLIGELTMAYQALEKISESWPDKRVKDVAEAIGAAAGPDVAAALTDQLTRLSAGCQTAYNRAWGAIEHVEEARQIVRSRMASGFTV